MNTYRERHKTHTTYPNNFEKKLRHTYKINYSLQKVKKDFSLHFWNSVLLSWGNHCEGKKYDSLKIFKQGLAPHLTTAMEGGECLLLGLGDHCYPVMPAFITVTTLQGEGNRKVTGEDENPGHLDRRGR